MGTFGAHRRLISRRLTASNILASRCFLNSVVNRDFTSIAVTDLPSSSHALNFNKLIANAHHVTRISCQDGRAFSMSLWPKIESSVTVENECVEKPTIVNVAGCGFGKSLFMRSSNKITPVLEGTMKFGEDACFISSFGPVQVAGVADGVGGWNQMGVDPSKFSSQLMKNCEEIVKHGNFEPTRPDLLIKLAYERMKVPPRPIGSSTVCILIVHHKTLYSANLGDSGFLLCRRGQVAYRSIEQVHTFNTPYQLTLLPEKFDDDDRFIRDGPEKIELHITELLSDDTVVLGTDGLWDNLHESTILRLLGELESKQSTPQERCNVMASMVLKLATSEDYMSPFSKKAETHGKCMPGGKPDDTSIVLMQII